MRKKMAVIRCQGQRPSDVAGHKVFFLGDVTFQKMEYHVLDEEKTWEDAVSYAQSLGDGWRLPTRTELQAYSQQLREQGLGGWFWTASSVDTNLDNAWYVALGSGSTFIDEKKDKNNVLCLRPWRPL
jgi:hypothetical protein